MKFFILLRALVYDLVAYPISSFQDLILQVVAGDEPSMLNFDQIQAINEWLEQLDDNHTDRKRLHCFVIANTLLTSHYTFRNDVGALFVKIRSFCLRGFAL